MAAKKKVVKRSIKKNNVVSIRKFTPPKGYTVMDVSVGDFAPIHDFNLEPVVQGIVVGVHDVETGKGKTKKTTQIMTIKTEQGNRGIWLSKMLEDLFSEPPIDRLVYIEFLGIVDIPGRVNGMKQFAIAVK